jgi:YHS domain-containing protein
LLLTARQYLANDLSFTGPSASFTSAEAFLRASAHVGSSVRTVHIHKLFVDGSDVAVFHELGLGHANGAVQVAEWYRLDGEQIASIRTILDTAPFVARNRAPVTATAQDPVCHMTVEKASAAATRVHADTTYFFCNQGCADAFEREPGAYLAATA